MADKPLVLMILDGWGIGETCPSNAITAANPKNFYRLQANYPSTSLEASGRAVGLPDGQMGNSEVGHLNIGAGRVVYQEITRISEAIEDGTFFANPELCAAIAFARHNQGTVHLMGLVSDGGVHSHLDHLYALLKLCKQQGAPRVMVHCFLDGRDVPPASALTYIKALEDKMGELSIGQIATVMGRYWAMDRDKHWERNEKAYYAMVAGEGLKAPNARAAIQQSYESRVTDEFVEPSVIVDDRGEPVGLVRNGDGIIFFNFRADRARQITRAFVDQEFTGFNRRVWPRTYYVCLTQYDVTIEAPVAFSPQNLTNTLGEVLSEHGLHQLRIAETEKYAHVTFFFNGGVEEPSPLEERILIPSPPVPTYNLKPEMSAYEVTSRVIEEINRDKFDVVIMNYANADMVGHTGILDAAIRAIRAVDDCLDKVVNRVLEKGGIVLITADHGNAETMCEPGTEEPHTAHTCCQVPFILVSNEHRGYQLRDSGSLRDIAPTILSLLNVAIPAEMTGKNLVIIDTEDVDPHLALNPPFTHFG